MLGLALWLGMGFNILAQITEMMNMVLGDVGAMFGF